MLFLVRKKNVYILKTVVSTNLFIVLASSLVFNLADGQFSSRADLIDAPGSSVGRGAQVAGLGEISFLLLIFCCYVFRYYK